MHNLSKKHGIPLSTLKFNAKVLKKLGLVEITERKRAALSRSGWMVLSFFNCSERPRVDLNQVQRLKEVSRSLRNALSDSLHDVNGFHQHSSLSCMDILLTLMEGWLRLGLLNLGSIVLSKGHAAPALYVALAEYGLIPRRELKDVGKLGSRLQTHPDSSFSIPLVTVSTGSLGQGLSVANGIALAMKLSGRAGNVYVLMGDGELDEGQVWEAAATAASHALDNVIAVVDRNGWQLSGPTEAVKRKGALRAKWESFGWEVFEVDGHDHCQLMEVFMEAEAKRNGSPKAVLAKTSGG